MIKPSFFFLILGLGIFLGSCEKAPKRSKQEEYLQRAQKQIRQNQKEVADVEENMNEKAKALAKERTEYYLKGNIPNSCTCGSSETHNHFPVQALSPTAIQKLVGEKVGPLLLHSAKLEISANKVVSFQGKLVNLDQKMLSGKICLQPLAEDGTPLKISLLPPFQEKKSPLWKDLPESVLVEGKVNLVHLNPYYEVLVSLKIQPGLYPYYEWALALNAFQKNRYRIEFVDGVMEDPSLTHESGSHQHQPLLKPEELLPVEKK
ncbi:MAG: hypothetical protein AABZ60_23150 [Planctomycetota bacterium]